MRYLCTICGYAHEGEVPPPFCPQCDAPESKFKLLDTQGKGLADEHRVGVVEGIDPNLIGILRKEFERDCTHSGLHLAMARQAEREGFPEVGAAFQRIAAEDADHAARLAELLGEALYADTRRNLDMEIAYEHQSCETKKKVASGAKQLDLDPIHDSLHEMSKNHARHHNMLLGLRTRLFE